LWDSCDDAAKKRRAISVTKLKYERATTASEFGQNYATGFSSRFLRL
jgi:hypothetical protein